MRVRVYCRLLGGGVMFHLDMHGRSCWRNNVMVTRYSFGEVGRIKCTVLCCAVVSLRMGVGV